MNLCDYKLHLTLEYWSLVGGMYPRTSHVLINNSPITPPTNSDIIIINMHYHGILLPNYVKIFNEFNKTIFHYGHFWEPYVENVITSALILKYWLRNAEAQKPEYAHIRREIERRLALSQCAWI